MDIKQLLLSPICVLFSDKPNSIIGLGNYQYPHYLIID